MESALNIGPRPSLAAPILAVRQKVASNRLLFLVITFSVVYFLAYILNSTLVVSVDGKLTRFYTLFDDAMISMRYAWNLSHGLGPVWNQGEFVEGYTNPLMVLLMAAVTFFFDKSHSVLVVQLLNLVILVGVGLVSVQLTLNLAQKANPENLKLVKILAYITAAGYYPIIFWTLLGMETGLLTLLELTGLLVAFRFVENPSKAKSIQMGLLFGLAFLTRPDALVMVAPVLVYLAYELYKMETATRFKLENLAYLLGALGLIVAAQELFRFVYYGEWVPNTYVLKATGMPLDDRLRNGAIFVGPFVTQTLPVLVMVLIGLVLNRSRKYLLFFSIMLALIGYQIYVGGDAWNYWRIVCPAVPLLFIAIINLLLVRFRIMPLFSSAVILCMLVLINVPFIHDLQFDRANTSIANSPREVQKVLILNEVCYPDATIGVLTAGTVPYYTGFKAVDFLGKMDKRIAQLPPDMSGNIAAYGMNSLPGHNKADFNYSIKELKPDYIELVSWGSQDVVEWSKGYYQEVEINGFVFYFLKGSAKINWEKIAELSR